MYRTGTGVKAIRPGIYAVRSTFDDDFNADIRHRLDTRRSEGVADYMDLHDAKVVKGVLEGKIGNITFQKAVQLAPGEERTISFNANDFAQLNVKNPCLWWPKGYGEPNLYDANFTFKINNKVSDTYDYKAGIRQMTYNEDNHDKSLTAMKVSFGSESSSEELLSDFFFISGTI